MIGEQDFEERTDCFFRVASVPVEFVETVQPVIVLAEPSAPSSRRGAHGNFHDPLVDGVQLLEGSVCHP
jgi:hypothetical protein